MRRISFLFAVLCLGLLVTGCESPCEANPNCSPLSPGPLNWLDVELRFDTLPTWDEPSELIFDIIVIGKDMAYPVNSVTGDTLNHLLLWFYNSLWVEGLNTTADSLWAGPVEIGQQIVLRTITQLDSTQLSDPGDKPEFSFIRLAWVYYSTNYTVTQLEALRDNPNVYGFGFNPETGNYYTRMITVVGPAER